jgi:hypothetical protein
MPDVSVKVNPNLKGDLGRYKGIKGERVGHFIEIRLNQEHPSFTMVHELGHFLDHWGIDTDGDADASEDGGSPMAKPIMEALFASPEVKALLKEQNRTKVPEARQLYSYLAKPTEILARAYSQYIAQRSNHPAMMAGLEKDRRGTFKGPAKQWSDASFEPIAEAFDRMFDAKKWSRRQ